MSKWIIIKSAADRRKYAPKRKTDERLWLDGTWIAVLDDGRFRSRRYYRRLKPKARKK